MRAIGFILLIGLFNSAVRGQEVHYIEGAHAWTGSPQYENYSHQLRLVDSIRQFILTDLKLEIGKRFYTDFEDGSDSMYVFLYVSRGDTIAVPDNVPQSLWKFKFEDLAIERSSQLKTSGYHTLVYKTAGMSNAMLNRKLLSYPDEAIAFILFHEATHKHVGMEIEYEYVEALCDAVASLAIVRFAQKTKMLDLNKVNQQKMVFEKAYALLNDKRREADHVTVAARKKICRACNEKIKSLIRPANQFVKDRMGYEVNNAYFLRIEAYAKHYFELKERLTESVDIDKAMTGLPTVKPKTETKEIEIKKEFNSSPFYQWDSK